MDWSERGWIHCMSLFSEHVGQTKIFSGSWKCRILCHCLTVWNSHLVPFFSDCACLHHRGCLLHIGSLWHLSDYTLSSAPDLEWSIPTWLCGIMPPHGFIIRWTFSASFFCAIASLTAQKESVKYGDCIEEPDLFFLPSSEVFRITWFSK